MRPKLRVIVRDRDTQAAVQETVCYGVEILSTTFDGPPVTLFQFLNEHGVTVSEWRALPDKVLVNILGEP